MIAAILGGGHIAPGDAPHGLLRPPAVIAGITSCAVVLRQRRIVGCVSYYCFVNGQCTGGVTARRPHFPGFVDAQSRSFHVDKAILPMGRVCIQPTGYANPPVCWERQSRAIQAGYVRGKYR